MLKNSTLFLLFNLLFACYGTLSAQCPGNLNPNNFGFEDGDLTDYGAFRGDGIAITTDPAEVINGTTSATVQSDDAILKFYFGSITAGTEYAASMLTNELTGGGYGQIQIEWFEANADGSVGSRIGDQINGTYMPNGTSTLVETAPAGARHAQLIFQAGGGTVVAVDDICFAEAQELVVAPNCDGNLYPNSSFEDVSNVGFSFGPGTQTIVSDAVTGTNALSVDASTGGGGREFDYPGTEFAAGEGINVSAMVKTTNGGLTVEFVLDDGTKSFGGTNLAMDGANFTMVSTGPIAVPANTVLFKVFTTLNDAIIVDDICVINAGVILPVTLTAFNGEATAKTNKLSWTTATEENTAMFYVERSTDGVSNWEEVTTVNATGNSQTERTYAAQDEQPLIKSYYRLRTVDFDGSEQLSDVILLTRTVAADFVAYPNPFSNQLTLTTDLETATDYRLMDGLGRTLSQGKVAAGAQTTLIATQALPAGRYLIRVGERTIAVVK